MCSARILVVRALGWSWMGMACAVCVRWWCGCGTGMRLVLAGNGPAFTAGGYLLACQDRG